MRKIDLANALDPRDDVGFKIDEISIWGRMLLNLVLSIT